MEAPLIQTLNPQTTSTVSRGAWLGCLVLSSHAKQYQPHLTPGFPVRVQVQRNQYWCHLLSFFCNNITPQCIIGEFLPRKKQQQHPACWFTCDQFLSRSYCSLENVDLLMDYNNNDGGCQKVQFFDTMEHTSKSTQYQLKELCLPQLNSSLR